MARSRWLIWLLVVLVITASSAAAIAIYMLLNQSPGALAHAGEAQQDTAHTRAEPPVDPIYLKLEPFTVNLAEDNGGPRMLYMGITLQLGDQLSQQAIDRIRPQVRNRVVLMLSGRKAEDLVTPEGKQQLATDLTTGLSELLAENHSDVNISHVLFTEFIVQ
ncbi:flagellar basal body-associated protein FliL [Halomonas huangheensis]|uniref:Flagellar protein FliL n=1 Tax=Halomonas huangheensis TaxID=1178482 RepID=W1N5J4_9GAMM|nr:flagellar basal body-associated protein FliL [Halomonas huangheensis]ALM54238.1 hypothetical protein AR456_19675 [Halomonas huangheensis]ERL50784.1 hypothetical protein BJB45_19505 [Halomonas huangheensis]